MRSETSTAMHLDDLAAALAADRDRGFTRVVQALQHGVYSGVLRMLGNPADAEEVTQDAFIRAYDALGGYSAERIRGLDVRSWVWTIAANQARNRARSRRRKPEARLDPTAGPPTRHPGPEEAALAGTGLADLAAALTTLPWAMRAAIVLRHVVDLTYDDVAAVLGRPIGTVKSDVHRGLDRLRAILGEGDAP